MMHFFRRSKIHLDVFTTSRGVIETAPVDYAHKFLPNWWKALPKRDINSSGFPSRTMKTCVGVRDYYSTAIAIPMWSDLQISVRDSEFTWQFADECSNANIHSAAQYRGFVQPDKVKHLKLESPWLFETTQDVNWVFSNPMYNTEDFFDYAVCPGVLNFKKQSSTNIQLMLNLTTNKDIHIPFNTPLAFLTPLSDKKVVIHRHLISTERYDSKRQNNPHLTFINSYMTRLKHINQCPFKDELK